MSEFPISSKPSCSVETGESSARMTPELVKQICKEKELYSTPRLNERLFLHFRGFARIQNLEKYTNVRALFLENNVIEEIENIEHMKDLRCLYLQNNRISRIQNLEHNPELVTLNLSDNLLTHIEGLASHRHLSTLLIGHNKIQSLADLEPLLQYSTIAYEHFCIHPSHIFRSLRHHRTLDLSHNEISDPAVIDIFSQMPHLACLYVKGNPFVSKVRHFRKTMISKIATLTFLDDRPVFPKERRLVSAW